MKTYYAIKTPIGWLVTYGLYGHPHIAISEDKSVLAAQIRVYYSGKGYKVLKITNGY